MKTTRKTFKTAMALICALALAFTITGCGSAQEYVFEAEHAVITDGSGMWPPVTQVGVDASGNELVRVDGISNFSDGSAMTWKITSDKAATATITLSVGSHLRDWGVDDGMVHGIEDISKALSLTVNGASVAITGSVPEGSATLSEESEDTEGALAYYMGKTTVEVELAAGENTIVFTSLGTGEEYNLFMDSLVVETSAELTFTQTDNSDRVWGM